jgi:type I restriction enzyme S subunit
MSCEGYNEVRLEEIAQFKTGKLNSNATIKNGKYPFFTCSPQMLKIGTFAFDQKAILLAGNNADGNFSIKYFEGKFNAYQRTYIINPINDQVLNIKYLYYSLGQRLNEFKRLSQGTSTKFLTAVILKNLILLLPSLTEQEAIADTLSCLDDRIELNSRINKTLEEIAQAIFKSWFVDFEPFQNGQFVNSELGPIPKGWRVGILGEIANITMGQSPNGSSYNEENNGTVFYQGRAEFGWRFPTRRLFTTEPNRLAAKGSVLLSVRAPVGDINIASEQCCIGRGLAALQSKNNYSSFVLYTMFNLKEQLNVFNGEGTVFGSINKDTLNKLKVLIPTEISISKYETIVASLDGQISNNSEQNEKLFAIRDALLPKLMSGEIEV